MYKTLATKMNWAEHSDMLDHDMFDIQAKNDSSDSFEIKYVTIK